MFIKPTFFSVSLLSVDSARFFAASWGLLHGNVLKLCLPAVKEEEGMNISGIRILSAIL